MNYTKLDDLLYDLEEDVDAVARKMKKVIFPVNEDNFGDPNFLRLYSCARQYSVLARVCKNIIKVIEESHIKGKRNYIEAFNMLLSTIPTYDFDNLEICPEAEELKLKYVKFIKAEKINVNTL